MGHRYIFKDFSEYWYYARPLSIQQREVIFDNLDQDQKEVIEDSYVEDGWVDVMCRNEIDEFLDKIKEKFGYDILNIRIKVRNGNSVYIPKKMWDIITRYLHQYRDESISYILSGIKTSICKENDQIILLHNSNPSNK